MDVNTSKFKLIFICSLTMVLFLLSSQYLFAYEREIKSISSTIAESITKSGKKTVAVVDFTDLQGNVTELGRFLAEEFSVALAGAGKGFEVVDRTHLKTILKEHKLTMSGLVDPQTAKKLGQIAGVDCLITGATTPFGDTVRISVKILDTATARVIGASSGDIAKTKAIEELIGKGIETGGPTGSTTPTPPKSTIKVQVDDFIFEVKGCKISGNKVKCIIAITNTAEKEKLLEIGGASEYRGGHSIMYDNLGNQYLPKILQFGTDNNLWEVKQIIPPHIPLNALFTFEDVASQATVVTLRIRSRLENENNKRFYPLLRNIPLSR